MRRFFADEKARFLLVGGTNTVVGYGLFVVFELTIGRTFGYLVSLYLSYVIAVALAFLLHRRFTFRVSGTGNAGLDFTRFASVYVVTLAINTAALPLLVELVGLTPLVAQAIVVMLTTAVSYFGHKYFSFRRGPRIVDPNEDPRAPVA
jgi:putative flippase GtrA